MPSPLTAAQCEYKLVRVSEDKAEGTFYSLYPTTIVCGPDAWLTYHKASSSSQAEWRYQLPGLGSERNNER